ncbi:fructosamine-3-kinase [Sphingomonas zeicaulis]|uniref:fructosamine kinase family protein n=1 Tax=Sphingomonas zeicaulis TaxID=1632740 RepID=UPI003D1F2B0C
MSRWSARWAAGWMTAPRDPDRVAIECLLGRAVTALQPLAGGDISGVWLVTLADGGRVVAKAGDTAAAEAEMLAAIAAAGGPAPAVLAFSDALLLIEHLPSEGGLAGPVWKGLAASLAPIHAATGAAYGWHRDHRFGPVAIENRQSADWPAFWADRRLRCHLPDIASALARRIERLADGIGDHLPARPPASLLHGDLWGGNVLVDGDRISGLIDPACYHGDREVDVAMLTLFDQPPSRFFEAMALDAGWRDRLPVYRLWPLLVHLRLFGAGYAGAVDAELDRLGV